MKPRKGFKSLSAFLGDVKAAAKAKVKKTKELRGTTTAKCTSPESTGAIRQIASVLAKLCSDISFMDAFAGMLLVRRGLSASLLQPRATRPLALPGDRDMVRCAARAARHAAACYGWKTVYSLQHGGRHPAGIGPRQGEEPAAWKFARSVESVCGFVQGIAPDDVVDSRWTGSTFDPAHYVAIDRRIGAVVVAVRGSHTVDDTVTDLAGVETTFGVEDVFVRGASSDKPFGLGFGNAHDGIVRCAHRKIAQIEHFVEAALESLPQPYLVLTGHSLGGGVAALCGLMFAAAHRDWQIEVYTFGCAATLSEGLARSQAAMVRVRSFIFRDDVVPHICRGSLESLKCLAKAVSKQSRSLRSSSTASASPSPSTPSPPSPPSPDSSPAPRGANESKSGGGSGGGGFFDWAADKVLGKVDFDAAISEARTEFASRDPRPSFFFPIGRIFRIMPVDVRAPASTSAPLPDRSSQDEVRTPATAVVAAAEETVRAASVDGMESAQSEESTSTTPASCTSASSTASAASELPSAFVVSEAEDVDWLCELPLTNTMISDHRLATYVGIFETLGREFA